MLDHEQFRAFAEHPELIDGVQELRAFAAHVKECASCTERLKESLSFQRQLVEPLRRGWKHLSDRELNSLRKRAFDPDLGHFQTKEEWHVVLCQECRTRYAGVSIQTRMPRAIRWQALTATTVLALGCAAITWQITKPPQSDDTPFRSPTRITLVTPADNSRVHVWQEFTWLPASASDTYSLIIRETASQKQVLEAKTKQTSYVLGPTDVAHMESGGYYEWFVNAQSDVRQLRSPPRHFNFVGSPKQIGYSEFPSSERSKLEDQVKAGSRTALPAVRSRLERYIRERQRDQTPDKAWALKNLGDVLYRLGQEGEALSDYDQSIALSEYLGIPDDSIYIAALVNYGAAAQDTGKLEAALGSYKKALKILEGRDETKHLKTRSACLLNIGTLYRTLGAPESARRSYEQALEIDRVLGGSLDVADELTNLGNLLVDELGEPQLGLKRLTEALDIHRDAIAKGGSARDSLADTWDGLGAAYWALKQPEKALDSYEQALRLDTGSSTRAGILLTTNSIASLLLTEMKDLPKAEARFRGALRIIEGKKDADLDQVWRTYDGLGRILLATGRIVESEDYFRRAIDIVERLRRSLRERQYRRTFKSDRTLPYYDLALLKMKQGNVAGAFEAVESARVTSLREIISTDGNPRVGSLVGLQEAQNTLSNGDLIVEYFFGDPADQLLVMVLDREKAFCYVLGSRRSLEITINRIADKVMSGSQRERNEADMQRLAADLLPGDVLERVRSRTIRRLILSPDGALHRVPWEIMLVPKLDRTKRIEAQAEVSLVPSVTWWTTEHRARVQKVANRDVLAVGAPLIHPAGCRTPSAALTDATSATRFEPLTFSRREADVSVSYGSFGSETLLAQQATKRNFTALPLADFKILHFATHAYAGRSLDTTMLLFGCSPDLDALTGKDILDLRLNQQLVVLSACATGMGRPLSAEGTESLAYAFLLAGARCVVSTRWAVRDDVPPRFMTFFYDSLSLGRSVDQAKAAAVLALLKRSETDLASVAAFTAIGACDMTAAITPNITATVSRWVGSRQRAILIACVTGLAVLILVYLFISARRAV